MKTITIPFSAFASLDGELTTAEWLAWRLA